MLTETKNIETVSVEQMQENQPTLPVDIEFAFSNHKGIYKRRIEKRQKKLLEKIGFIQPFLSEDERILLVTHGCSPVSIMEQMITGWIVFYLKQSLFIFTNKRIFHIPTKSGYKYRRSIAQIFYADCQKLYLKGGTLVAKYWNNQTEKFVYIAGKEKKKIKALLTVTPLEGQQSRDTRRTHLCPNCCSELVEGRYSCPQCGLLFKDKAQAKKVSIIYPGGGYFYTGHPFLGISDAFAETALAAILVTSVFETIKGTEGGWAVVISIGIVLAIEKAITIYHSNHFIKEFIPK